MKRIPFLTAEEIALKQAQESASDKPQKKTAEQIEAIYSSGQNILVSASAGSGKTFVMVQRIIDQILRGVAVSQLFISTFTVKAAGELKERLEKELGQALKEAESSELKQHLAQQLADLPNADIGTMDAFTQKVLSRYGYLLGLAPNFRILQSASEQLICKMKFSVKCLTVTMTAIVRLCFSRFGQEFSLVSARIYQASGSKFIGFTAFCSQLAALSAGWKKPSSMVMSTVILQQRESRYLVKLNHPFGSWKLSFLPIWSMKGESLRAPSIRKMSKTL